MYALLIVLWMPVDVKTDYFFFCTQERWIWETGRVKNLEQVLTPESAAAVRDLNSPRFAVRKKAHSYLKDSPDRDRAFLWGLFFGISNNQTDVRERCIIEVNEHFPCEHCRGFGLCGGAISYSCSTCRGARYHRAEGESTAKCRVCDGTGSWLVANGLPYYYFNLIPKPY